MNRLSNYDTVVAVWDGTMYRELQGRKMALMSQGAEIQGAKMRAQSQGDSEGIAWADTAMARNQGAKVQLYQASQAYDNIAEAIATYTYGSNTPARMGLGFLPAVAAIPATVEVILIVGGVIASIVLLWKAIDAFDSGIQHAAEILDKIPGVVGSVQGATMNLALVGAVGFGAYMLFSHLKKKGHV